jgi:transposase
VLGRLNRHDLTDEEWERLRVFLPADPRQSGRWRDHRTVINGIFFRARAGCPWRDLPEGVEQLVRQNPRSGYRRIQSELSKRLTKPLAQPVSMISWPTCTGWNGRQSAPRPPR